MNTPDDEKVGLPAEELERLLGEARRRYERGQEAAGTAALQSILSSFVPAIYAAAYRATRLVGRTSPDLVDDVASHLRLKVIELVDKSAKVRNFRHVIMAWTLRQQASAHVRQALSPVSIGNTFHRTLARQAADHDGDDGTPVGISLDAKTDDGRSITDTLVAEEDRERDGRIDREAMVKQLPPRLRYLTEVYIGRHGAELAGSSIAIAKHIAATTGRPVTGANLRIWFGQIRTLVRRIEEGIRGPKTHENARTAEWDRTLAPLLLRQPHA